MARFILGLHAGHNSGACIGDRSGLIYGIQEERLNGEKNYWGFPKLAIDACLKHVAAKPTDVLAVAYGGKQVLCRYHSREDVLQAYRRQASMIGRLRQQLAMPMMIAMRPNYGQKPFETLLAAEGLGGVALTYHDHHLSHAATAYYGLRRNAKEKYLVVTCDGAGDGLCATVRVMGGGENRLVSSTHWANSLGSVYSWVTYEMGFVPLEHEYKLMGMAPYASESAAKAAAKMFEKYLEVSPDGMQFARKVGPRMNDLHSTLAADMQGQRFDWLCAGLQQFTEDILTTWIGNTVRSTGVRNVLAGGGVFMNVKANKRIAELPEVDSFEAYPSCGDETLPLGALYLQSAAEFGDESVPPLQHFYLGDEITDQQAEAAIKSSGFEWEKPLDIADRVAQLMADGKPVARASGRMEFGARALGNRSILADPSNQDVVRVINQMVKKRDFWMPFAPMVMASRQHDYLQNPKQLRSPFMMMTFDSKPNFRELIAAVHNADLTCRAQILEPDQNPPMHAILQAFERRTGRGVILNTSFNLHGFPIVRTAEDALGVLQRSGLEHLQVGNFLVHKSQT